jgi:hypothetical protein
MPWMETEMPTVTCAVRKKVRYPTKVARREYLNFTVTKWTDELGDAFMGPYSAIGKAVAQARERGLLDAAFYGTRLVYVDCVEEAPRREVNPMDLLRTPQDLKPGDQIAYVPRHARGALNHPDVEYGFVTRLSHDGETAFCRYWQGRGKEGLRSEGLRTLACSEGTPVELLVRGNTRPEGVVDMWLAGIRAQEEAERENIRRELGILDPAPAPPRRRFRLE